MHIAQQPVGAWAGRKRFLGLVLTCAVLLAMPAALMAMNRFWVRREAGTPPVGPASTGESVFFQFDYPPAPETFVFEVNDPALIATARAGIAAGTDDLHVMGTILTTPVSYNPPWNYHLDPESIRLFNAAIEVCDASIAYVEANLDQVGGAFLPGATWCPWGSRLLKEVGTVPPPLSPTPPPSITLPAEPLFYRYLPLIGA